MLIRLLLRLRLLHLLMRSLLPGGGLHHEARDRRATHATISRDRSEQVGARLQKTLASLTTLQQSRQARGALPPHK